MKVNTLAMINTESFIDELLSTCVTLVTDPLPKNKRSLFSYPAVKGPSKEDKFFCRENHHCPLSMSLGGKLALGSNADILLYFEVETATSDESPPVDAQFLDGPAVCYMLNPGIAKTVLEYAVHVFCHICIRTVLLALTLFGMYFKQIDTR